MPALGATHPVLTLHVRAARHNVAGCSRKKATDNARLNEHFKMYAFQSYYALEQLTNYMG